MLPLRTDEIGGFWPVHEDYCILDGALYIAGAAPVAFVYRPEEHPQLPFELAKLAEASDGELLRFARTWGFLGYLEQAQSQRVAVIRALRGQVRPDSVEGGEPVGWIRAHGRNFDLCASLLTPLLDSDATAVVKPLQRFFELETVNNRDRVVLYWENILRYEFFLREERTEKFPIDRMLTETPLRLATFVIGLLVNHGMDGIGPTFDLNDNDVPAIRFRFDAMFQLAYMHVAQLFKEKSHTATCEQCGRPFKRTDARQRFCPGGPFTSGSACGYKFRYRKKPASEWRRKP